MQFHQWGRDLSPVGKKINPSESFKKKWSTEFPGLLESRKGGKQFQRTEKRQKTEAVRPPLEHLDDECKFDNAPSSRLCVPVLSKLCFAKARAPSSI